MHRVAMAPSKPLLLELRAQPSAPLNNQANESRCQQVCSSPAHAEKDALLEGPRRRNLFH